MLDMPAAPADNTTEKNMLAPQQQKDFTDLEAILSLDQLTDSPAMKDSNEFPGTSTDPQYGKTFASYANAFDSAPYLTSPVMDDSWLGFDMSAPLFGDESPCYDLVAAESSTRSTPPLDPDNSPNNDDTPLNDFLRTPLMTDDSAGPVGAGSAPPSLFPELSGTFDFESLFAPSGSAQPQMMTHGASLDPSATLHKAPLPVAADPLSNILPTTAPQASLTTSTTASPVSTDSAQTHSGGSAMPVSTHTKKPRRSNATGTRRNLTPSSLVPDDAPTQTRQYTIPSTTSRKEVPVTFARKRARLLEDEGEDIDMEELGELPPNATEREQIEWKRRQNTIAARKSRKRKLEHQRNLEDSVEKLTRERDVWKTRAMTLREVMKARGEELPGWEDELSPLDE